MQFVFYLSDSVLLEESFTYESDYTGCADWVWFTEITDSICSVNWNELFVLNSNDSFLFKESVTYESDYDCAVCDWFIKK